jgi:hypothetical protein
MQNEEMLTLTGGSYYVGFIKLIGVVTGVRKQRLALSTGLNRVGSA